MATGPDDQQTRLRPLHPCFGVSVHGFSFPPQDNIDDASAQWLRETLDQHSLLVFPATSINVRQQVQFSQALGPLEVAISGLSDDRYGRHVSNLSNLDADGNVVSPTDSKMLSHAANRLWHTDSTFKPIPALASILSARQLPPTGGETEFASTRAAWQDLDSKMRASIEHSYAIHDFSHSRAKVAKNLVDDELKRKLPPQRRPLVRTNPRTGKRSIYIASHACAVEGMDNTEATQLIDELLNHCTQSQYVYRHQWQTGDLVVWDNRATIHRGRPWDDANYARVMYRTTVEDHEAP